MRSGFDSWAAHHPSNRSLWERFVVVENQRRQRRSGVNRESMLEEIVRTAPSEPIAAPPWPFTVTVAMPAFHEVHVIGDVIRGVRAVCPDAEILVVSDGATDGTAEAAERAGARVVRHPYNIGNGAAV